MFLMKLICRAKQDSESKHFPTAKIVRLASWKPLKEGEKIEGPILPMVDVMLSLEREDADKFELGKEYQITIEGEYEWTSEKK